MNLAIFGATGGTGRLLVDQALAAGHHVAVLARTPASLPLQHEFLRVVQGDARDQDGVASVVAGQDAVLSALGPSKQGSATLCTEATTQILTAMTHAPQVRRLIALSAYGAADSHERNLYNRMLWLMLKKKMVDKELMEDVIVRSAVDWTVVRPSFLTNGPETRTYRTGTDLHMAVTSRIARADVAAFMLRLATDDTYVRQTPAITS